MTKESSSKVVKFTRVAVTNVASANIVVGSAYLYNQGADPIYVTFDGAVPTIQNGKEIHVDQYLPFKVSCKTLRVICNANATLEIIELQ